MTSKASPKENIVLFTGDDYARLDKALAGWTAEFTKRHGEANIEDVDMQNYSVQQWGTILGEMLTPSLFATKRLIILRHFPGEPTKKVSEDVEKMEQQCLETLLQVPEDIVILLVARKPDKRRAVYKKLVTFARVKEFLLKDIDVRAQVTLELAGMIAAEDISYVAQVLESRRESISQDMTILRQYGMTNQLTRQIVDTLCPPHLEESVFIILDAVFSGHTKEAISRLRHLFVLGAVPLQVLGAFSWQLEMLVIASAALSARMSAEEAASLLDMKPYSVNKAMQIARRMTMDQVATMVHGLARIDRLSKSGGLQLDGEDQDFSGTLAAWIMRVPVGASS